MSEEQYGGPVVEISSDRSVRVPSCRHCDDLRVLFMEKVTKIADDFNKMLGKATEIQKQSSSNHDELVLTLGALKKYANDCVMVIKDGQLGDPPTSHAGSFGMSSAKPKISMPATWEAEKVPSLQEIDFIMNKSIEDSFDKIIAAELSGSPIAAHNAQYQKIIKSNAIPCQVCIDGYVGMSICLTCNGTGMVDPKLVKKKLAKKESAPLMKKVYCAWCGFASQIIGVAITACPKCKKLLT